MAQRAVATATATTTSSRKRSRDLGNEIAMASTSFLALRWPPRGAAIACSHTCSAAHYVALAGCIACSFGLVVHRARQGVIGPRPPRAILHVGAGTFDRTPRGRRTRVHVGGRRPRRVRLHRHPRDRQQFRHAARRLHRDARRPVGTMALLSRDAGRPGVSIEMSQTFCAAAKVGERVTVVGTVLKAGGRLGFTQVEVRRRRRRRRRGGPAHEDVRLGRSLQAVA